MRIVVDLQGAQTASRFRGIGRYAMEFTKALIRNRGDHELIIALNALFPDTIIPIRQSFKDLLPEQNIVVWDVPGPVAERFPETHARREVAELVREAFLASLNPDIIHITSLFEGYIDDAVTSIGRFAASIPVSVTLYDLIPYLDRDEYFKENRNYGDYYFRKIDHLGRARLLLGISKSASQEAIEHLGWDEQNVVTVGTGGGDFFRKTYISDVQEEALRLRYGIERPFFLYASGGDARKNHRGLIEAYAQLPIPIRRGHQLVLVGFWAEPDTLALSSHVKKLGLAVDEVIFTGGINDDDLNGLYNLCKGFVMPSWHEGFGLPALEAMQCGCAVIASSTSSLPEVIGRKDALFDPYDVKDISRSLLRLATDDAWRQELQVHALEQARFFTWDNVARNAIAAFEEFHEHRAQPADLARTTHRSKLAFVSPLPPHESGISGYSSALLPELSKYYDIEVVVDQDEIIEPFILACFPVRSFEWLDNHANEYDRIIYQFGNSSCQAKMFSAVQKHPGIVVLHDFVLSAAQVSGDSSGSASHEFIKALQASHGYKGIQYIKDADVAEVTRDFPVNLPVLQGALGVIVHDENFFRLGKLFYGNKATESWRLILLSERLATMTPSKEVAVEFASSCAPLEKYDSKPVVLSKHISSACAAFYAQTIEAAYAEAETGLHGLIHALQRQGLVEQDMLQLANALARNFPPKPRRPQLLVDVSELARADSKTGIQRVVRSILEEWLNYPPAGWQVEPVYTLGDSKGYRYARKFTSRFLGIPNEWAEDEFVEAWLGDVFVGLDLVSDRVKQEKVCLQNWHNRGIKVWFVIYDLLPVLMPEVFPEGSAAGHHSWLEFIGLFDGEVCISKTVADEFRTWLAAQSNGDNWVPEIKWAHLGADIDRSAPSVGLPYDAQAVLAALNDRPSFLMVGTVEPRKGHLQTIEAFERLWQEGAEVNLVIVGAEGWKGMPEYMRRTIPLITKKLHTHSELGRRLFWLNGISDEYLEKIYAASTCLIASSYGEGFGLPLIEAAQHGLPILARDIPVFREVAGGHALYFSGDGTSDLEAGVRNWLAQKSRGSIPDVSTMPWQTWKQCAAKILEAIGIESSSEVISSDDEAPAMTLPS